MKKSALSAAIQTRKQLNDTPLELEASSAPQPAQPVAKETKRRFHTTLYPDPELYRNVRIALLQEGQGRDFNQLVNTLLADWYAENGE